MRRAHGGRVNVGVADFSSPSNPLGPPPIVNEIIMDYTLGKRYSVYPDYEYKRFEEVIAGYYSLDPELVVPLNGSAEALQLLLPALKPSRLIAVEPTFGDHKLQSRALGIPLVTIPYIVRGSRYELDPGVYCGLPMEFRVNSVILVSNPNNPTGALASKSVLEEIISCSGRGSIMVVDEAFSDFTYNRESLLGLKSDDIVVLRSFTKIFNIQGLRAGFLYTGSKGIARLVDSVRQPWNVNSLAVEIVTRILEWQELGEYIRRSIGIVEVEREFLAGELSKIGLQVYDSKTPFILVRHTPRHPEVNEKLLSKGYHVRDASSFTYLTPHHSRVSVRLRDENQGLIEALREVIEELMVM